ncbi:unnamed protein product, partial [Effrenium voratum]
PPFADDDDSLARYPYLAINAHLPHLILAMLMRRNGISHQVFPLPHGPHRETARRELVTGLALLMVSVTMMMRTSTMRGCPVAHATTLAEGRVVAATAVADKERAVAVALTTDPAGMIAELADVTSSSPVVVELPTEAKVIAEGRRAKSARPGVTTDVADVTIAKMIGETIAGTARAKSTTGVLTTGARGATLLATIVE